MVVDLISNNLDKYGFDALTGEACRLGTRILYDMTPDAARLLAELLGMRDTTSFAEAWNGRDGAEYSALIGRDTMIDLCVLIGVKHYPQVVRNEYGQILGIRDGAVRTDYDPDTGESSAEYKSDDCEWLPWPSSYGAIERIWQGLDSTRNRHQFSGRTE